MRVFVPLSTRPESQRASSSGSLHNKLTCWSGCVSIVFHVHALEEDLPCFQTSWACSSEGLHEVFVLPTDGFHGGCVCASCDLPDSGTVGTWLQLAQGFSRIGCAARQYSDFLRTFPACSVLSVRTIPSPRREVTRKCVGAFAVSDRAKTTSHSSALHSASQLDL